MGNPKDFAKVEDMDITYPSIGDQRIYLNPNASLSFQQYQTPKNLELRLAELKSKGFSAHIINKQIQLCKEYNIAATIDLAATLVWAYRATEMSKIEATLFRVNTPCNKAVLDFLNRLPDYLDPCSEHDELIFRRFIDITKLEYQ